MSFETKNIPICLIVACDSKYGIAKKNSIPWKIKADMDYFNSITTNAENNSKNVVIYGKQTWMSLKNKILKDRINIVLSSTEFKSNTIVANNLIFQKSLESAFEYIYNLNNIFKIFICGGKRLYEECISKNIINYFYINRIEHDYNCDVHLNAELIERCLKSCNKPELYEFEDKSLNKIVKMKFYNNNS